MKVFRRVIKLVKNASPSLRRRLIILFAILALGNGFVWIYALLLWQKYHVLLGLVTLAYGLGLRHAVDADHIAAIDNVTRKLMQDKKRPVGVGFFFSLGHSTIVVLLSLLVSLSTTFVKSNLPTFKTIGTIIGTSVSSFFLLTIGIINVFVLIDIFRMWRKIVKKQGTYAAVSLEEHLEKRGLLIRILKPFLKTVRNSWQMYLVGFLFGLGFDTASEVSLLSISAATGVSGMPIGTILILPLAFTAGMALIDTLDGVLMLGTYGWAYIKPIRKLYYNMNITFTSVILALFIGSIEGMQIIFSQLNITGGFFDYIKNIDFSNLGYIIIGIFIASWVVSLSIYKYKKYDVLEVEKG